MRPLSVSSSCSTSLAPRNFRNASLIFLEVVGRDRLGDLASIGWKLCLHVRVSQTSSRTKDPPFLVKTCVLRIFWRSLPPGPFSRCLSYSSPFFGWPPSNATSGHSFLLFRWVISRISVESYRQPSRFSHNNNGKGYSYLSHTCILRLYSSTPLLGFRDTAKVSCCIRI